MKKNIRNDKLSKLRFLLPDRFPTQAWYSHGRKLFKASEYMIDLAIPDVNTTKDIIFWFYDADENSNILSHDDLSVNEQKRLVNKLKLTLNQLHEDANNIVKNKQNEARDGLKKFIEIPDISNIYGLYDDQGVLLKIILTNWATVHDILNPKFSIIQRLKIENVLLIRIKLIDKNGELKQNFPVIISFGNLIKPMVSNNMGIIEIDEIDKNTSLKIWQEIRGEAINFQEHLIQNDDDVDYIVTEPVEMRFLLKDDKGEVKPNMPFIVTYKNNFFEVYSDTDGCFVLDEIIPGENLNITIKE